MAECNRSGLSGREQKSWFHQLSRSWSSKAAPCHHTPTTMPDCWHDVVFMKCCVRPVLCLHPRTWFWEDRGGEGFSPTPDVRLCGHPRSWRTGWRKCDGTEQGAKPEFTQNGRAMKKLQRPKNKAWKAEMVAAVTFSLFLTLFHFNSLFVRTSLLSAAAWWINNSTQTGFTTYFVNYLSLTRELSAGIWAVLRSEQTANAPSAQP